MPKIKFNISNEDKKYCLWNFCFWSNKKMGRSIITLICLKVSIQNLNVDFFIAAGLNDENLIEQIIKIFNQ